MEPRYEGFVVHAVGAEAFVQGYLLPAMGLPRQRVMVAGGEVSATKLDELEKVLEESRVFVVVLTPAFLADPWAQVVEQWVVHAAISAERAVIPLILEDCEVPLHLRVSVQLDLRQEGNWESELARLRRVWQQPPPMEPELACPYPGMRPFQAGDAPQFYGREREVTEIVERLRGEERELVVVGPSGSGKSSLIYAGVLPVAKELKLEVRSFRPGEDPVARLREALGVEPSDGASDVELDLPQDLAACVEELLAERGDGARLLLFIDQLEEIFTLASWAQRERFAAGIARLREHPRCALLFTLRADFLAELMQSPLWRDGASHVNVAPLRGAALRAAIVEPARAMQVYLEPALVERLIADAATATGALPLLQETLVQLWEWRKRRLISAAMYQAMGSGTESGLAFAIGRRADRCFHEMTERARWLARRVLLRLVTFGEGRPNTRRQQLRSALAGGEHPDELSAVLGALTTARLLVLDGGMRPDEQEDKIDLAHEALITAWPPLAQWIRLRRADEEQRRLIEQRAARWIAKGRGPIGLLDVGELAAAQMWRKSDASPELGETAEMIALVAASEARLQQKKTRRSRQMTTIIAILLCFTALSTVMTIVANDRDTAVKIEAESKVISIGEAQRRALLAAERQERAEQRLALAEQRIAKLSAERKEQLDADVRLILNCRSQLRSEKEAHALLRERSARDEQAVRAAEKTRPPPAQSPRRPRQPPPAVVDAGEKAAKPPI